MSAMGFPGSPTNGDTYEKWVYDAASSSWLIDEAAITLSGSTTDDLAEGSTNLYFTAARVQGELLDEDNMASDDATKAPTQQSTKAYVDATVASGGLITTSGLTAATLVTEADTIAANDNDTTIPTSAAVKDYVDGSGFIDGIVAGNGLTGDSTSGTASLAVGAGTGITVNANDVTVNADQRGNVTLIGANTDDYIETGTTNHSFVLDGNVDARLFNNGEFHADGDVVAFSTSISDQRFKNQVTPVTNATETCKKLQGVEYTWNATGRKGKRDMGFIAQEVEKVLPNIVHIKTLGVGEWADNPMDAKTVDYEKLTAVLVEAVKELSARIDELESK
jgi:hypothetical protein